jgi:hypothetical protein
MWQDLLLSIVQWGFIAALMPTLLHKTQKPTVTTCAFTALGMLAITITYISLELWAAVASSSLLTLAWVVLAHQRYKLNAQALGEPIGQEERPSA